MTEISNRIPAVLNWLKGYTHWFWSEEPRPDIVIRFSINNEMSVQRTNAHPQYVLCIPKATYSNNYVVYFYVFWIPCPRCARLREHEDMIPLAPRHSNGELYAYHSFYCSLPLNIVPSSIGSFSAASLLLQILLHTLVQDLQMDIAVILSHIHSWFCKHSVAYNMYLYSFITCAAGPTVLLDINKVRANNKKRHVKPAQQWAICSLIAVRTCNSRRFYRLTDL